MLCVVLYPCVRKLRKTYQPGGFWCFFAALAGSRLLNGTAARHGLYAPAKLLCLNDGRPSLNYIAHPIAFSFPFSQTARAGEDLAGAMEDAAAGKREAESLAKQVARLEAEVKAQREDGNAAHDASAKEIAELR